MFNFYTVYVKMLNMCSHQLLCDIQILPVYIATVTQLRGCRGPGNGPCSSYPSFLQLGHFPSMVTEVSVAAMLQYMLPTKLKSFIIALYLFCHMFVVK
jgi:hypothetical protein